MITLITGACGFVGTNLTLKLLKEGHKVIAIDSLSRRGSEDNLQRIKESFPHLDFRQKEIEDVPNTILREKPELVYHFAAQVAVTSSVENPTRDFRINAEGTFNIAKASHDIGVPVIYTSTNKVFGDNVNHVPLQELDTRYDFKGDLERKGIPENFSIDATHHTPYGVSKLVGDLYVREFGGIANRCSCMYGPNQNGIVDQGWISHIARRVIKGEKIEVYGDGKQVRDALHSDDIVELLMKEGRELLAGRNELRGEVFNVGGGYHNTISILELLNKWKVDNRRIEFKEWRLADQKVFYCDISKAEKVFGWKPKVSLDKGLKEIFRWTEKNIYV